MIFYLLDKLQRCGNRYKFPETRADCVKELIEKLHDEELGCLDCLCDMMLHDLCLPYEKMVPMVESTCYCLGRK